MSTHISQSREVEVLPWGENYSTMAPTAERLGALGFLFKVYTGEDIYQGGSAMPELELYDKRFRPHRVWPREFVVVTGYREFVIIDKHQLKNDYTPTEGES